MSPWTSLPTLALSLLVKNSCGFASFADNNATAEMTEGLTNDASTELSMWCTFKSDECRVAFCRSPDHCEFCNSWEECDKEWNHIITKCSGGYFSDLTAGILTGARTIKIAKACQKARFYNQEQIVLEVERVNDDKMTVLACPDKDNSCREKYTLSSGIDTVQFDQTWLSLESREIRKVIVWAY